VKSSNRPMIGRTKSDTPPDMIPRYAIRLSSFWKGRHQVKWTDTSKPVGKWL